MSGAAALSTFYVLFAQPSLGLRCVFPEWNRLVNHRHRAVPPCVRPADTRKERWARVLALLRHWPAVPGRNFLLSEALFLT